MTDIYTTADLLSDIKQEGMIPTSQETWTDARILTLATRMLRTQVVPFLSSVREGYFTWTHSATLVSGTLRYPLPTRASALSLEDVLLKKGTSDYLSVPVIPASEKDKYGSDASTIGYNGAFGFYLDWNTLVMTKDMSGSWETLELPYKIRPGVLIETTDAAKVTAIDTDTGVVTVNTVPAAFTTSLEYDFIKGSGGYEYLALEKTASAVDSGAGTITFTASDLPSDLAVGDWVAQAGYSPVPQIPVEVAPVLVYETIIKILKSLGDWEGAKAAEMELEGEGNEPGLRDSVLKLISPRVKGETKFLVSGYRRGYGSW